MDRSFTLVVLLVALLAGCTGTPPGGRTGTPVVVRGEQPARLDEYLTHAAALGFSGAVLVARNGEIVFQKGYGLADRERGIPITPETAFDIGSITKQFTAAAILLLEEEGKLSVSDPITKYFDNVPDDKKGITLHHLLTHTAGLPLYSGDDYEVVSRETMIERTLGAKLLSPPREKYAYSNPGYSLLAAIVEKVSGQPYENFVRERLFRKAGMDQMGYTLPKWREGQVAHGYGSQGYQGTPISQPWAPDGPSWNLRGNGGMVGPVTNLYRWALALDQGKVLSRESQEKSTRPHVPTNAAGDTFYGYAWGLTRTPRGTRLVAHSGGNGTFTAHLNRYVDEGTTIVSATNDSTDVFRGVSRNLSKIVFGEEPPALPTARVRLPDSTLREYAGRYVILGRPSGQEFEVTLDRGQLTVPGTAPGIARLLTRFPEPPEEKLPPDFAAFAERVIRGVERGDLGPMEPVLWSDVKIDDERKYWVETWPEWVKRWGAFQGTEVLGARKSGDLVNLYVLLHFERGSRLVYFQRNAEGRYFLNTSTATPEARVLPWKYRFLPQSETELATYNFLLETEARIQFQRNETGAVEGFRVRDGEKEVFARKVG